MPYAARFNYNKDPNDPYKQNGQGGVNISGVQGADYSTNIPGQENQTKSKTSSGNYANIQSYLDANKDQGDQMGQTIASNVESKANEAQQKVTDYGSKAPSVQAYDPNEAYNNVTKLNDEQKNTYRTYKNTGGYSGPESYDKVDGYDDTQKIATEAATKAKNAGNEYGQQQLLKDQYARPNYTAGENKLDQTLLQNSSGSRQALEGISQKYSGLDKLFQDTTTNVGNAINQATTQAQANKQNIAQAEANQWNAMMSELQKRADETNLNNQKTIAQLTDDIEKSKNGTISENLMKMSGLKEGTRLFGLDPTKYFRPNNTQAGVNNVATADERAKYKALADLVGDPSRTQVTDKAETINPVTFNQAGFDAELKAKQDWFDELAKNTTLDDQFSFEHNGGQANGFAQANIADYLKNGSGAISPTFSYDQHHDPITRASDGRWTQQASIDATNGVRGSLTNKIEKWLQDAGYYNYLKKG